MRMTLSVLIVVALFVTPVQLEHPSAPNLSHHPDDDHEMVWIQGGHFLMGTDAKKLPELEKLGRNVPHMNEHNAAYWFSDEIPRHPVNVKSFWMDAHEVTNRQYREFVMATGYHAQGNWERWATEERDDFPVLNVSWHDADAYARWAGKRLPTEAEWEYAACAGSCGTFFPWGDEPDTARANFGHMETFFTGIFRLLHVAKPGALPVCSFPANAYGLHDMIGNVTEWCADLYTGYPGCGETEPPRGTRHVIRGGCWMYNPVFCRIQNRGGLPADKVDFRFGFRCAMDDSPETGKTDSQ